MQTGLRPRKLQLPHTFHFTDPDGTPMTSVTLRNTARRAHMPAAIHARIVASLGPRVTWTVNGVGPHVMARGNGEALTAARLVLGAAPRTRLHYHDGDGFNLRAANVRPGPSPEARAPRPQPVFKHDVVHHHRKGVEYVMLVKVEGATKRATIDKADYERLVDACGVTPWRVEGTGRGRRVVFQTLCPGIVQAVAEYVADAPKDAAMAHRDGKFLNLRAGNLVVVG